MNTNGIPAPDGMTRLDRCLASVTGLAMLAALYAVFLWVPGERTMGVVQRIFYFHVPAAFVAFAGFLVVFIASVMYLITRRMSWDRLAACSAELGLVFITITLVTGPIWAKPVWGIWWTWDARLTSSLVLGLIYLGYSMLRSYVYEPTRRAALSAVVGIIGFVDVPIVYFSIRWWRTQHPQPVLLGGEGSGLAPQMLQTLVLCLLTFVLLYVLLLRYRLQLESLAEEVDYHRQQLLGRGV